MKEHSFGNLSLFESIYNRFDEYNSIITSGQSSFRFAIVIIVWYNTMVLWFYAIASTVVREPKFFGIVDWVNPYTMLMDIH